MGAANWPCGTLAGETLFLVTSFLLAQVISGSGTNQAPPKALAQEARRVVSSGSMIQLPCGVEGDPSNLFFEWYRQGQPILASAGSLGALGTEDRFRVTQSGALKIKSALPEDTGYYTCRAVNGFGTARIGVTLIVLGNEDYDDIDQENPNNNLFPDRDDQNSKQLTKTKPEIVQITPQRLIQRPLGSSLRLKCEGKGEPKPRVAWLRNGQPFVVSSEFSAPPMTSEFPLGSRQGRWSLHLQTLRIQDGGNYTCLLHNSAGSINHTFVVQVVDVLSSNLAKPELTGDHPVNTTVEKGTTATLQCRVRSGIKPHIQWLKSLDKNEPVDENLTNVQGEFFRVLKSSEVLENPEGSFLNKLVIDDVTEADSGKYVCLGVNTEGYTFRSAYVTVLQPKMLRQGDWVSVSQSLSSVPFPITVAVSLLGLVLLACALVLLRRYLRRRYGVRRPDGDPNGQLHSMRRPLHNRTYYEPAEVKSNRELLDNANTTMTRSCSGRSGSRASTCRLHTNSAACV